MTNNEIFRTLLHLTGCGKDKDFVVYLFKLGGAEVSPSKIKAWRTDPDDDYGRGSLMPDAVLRAFFNGLFLYRDKMRESGVNVFAFPR